jgi:hypothetical protein
VDAGLVGKITLSICDAVLMCFVHEQ